MNGRIKTLQNNRKCYGKVSGLFYNCLLACVNCVAYTGPTTVMLDWKKVQSSIEGGWSFCFCRDSPQRGMSMDPILFFKSEHPTLSVYSGS